MSVTLKDIATELNISVTAVSRGLRNMPDISPETTKLIHQTAERLGYRKNFAASYLKTSKSMMLGIIVPDICNPVFSYIYEGIEKECNKKHYILTLGNSNENIDQEAAVMDKMVSHGVDGLFIIPSNESDGFYPQLDTLKVPYIILQRSSVKSPFLVRSNDYEGGYIAAQHLYELGHRSFLLLFPSIKNPSAKERYNGFKDYLAKRNVGESKIQLIECGITRTEGYRATKLWLNQHSVSPVALSASAIFCFSDYIAYGVYSALLESKYKVPDDISVIGYDNNEYSDIIYPALTTIDLLPYDIGKQSAKLMLNIVTSIYSSENPPINKKILSPKLIIRNSTKSNI